MSAYNDTVIHLLGEVCKSFDSEINVALVVWRQAVIVSPFGLRIAI